MESNTLAQFYQILSIAAFVLAGASFAFAIFCFFKFRIIKIINDLTGRTAKKSIEKKRSENEESGRNITNAEKQENKSKKNRESVNPMDRPKYEQKKRNSQATGILADNATQLLASETDILSVSGTAASYEETAVLNDLETGSENEIGLSEKGVMSSEPEIIQSIVLIHTNEII